MKNSFITVVGMLSALVALPAVAGPDWDAIHEAETYNATHEQQVAVRNNPTTEVMPLDHGPRALATPWLNKELKLEAVSRAQKNEAVLTAHTPHKVAAHG